MDEEFRGPLKKVERYSTASRAGAVNAGVSILRHCNASTYRELTAAVHTLGQCATGETETE